MTFIINTLSIMERIVMLSLGYIECHLCWMSHTSPLCWVSWRPSIFRFLFSVNIKYGKLSVLLRLCLLDIISQKFCPTSKLKIFNTCLINKMLPAPNWNMRQIPCFIKLNKKGGIHKHLCDNQVNSIRIVCVTF